MLSSRPWDCASMLARARFLDRNFFARLVAGGRRVAELATGNWYRLLAFPELIKLNSWVIVWFAALASCGFYRTPRVVAKPRLQKICLMKLKRRRRRWTSRLHWMQKILFFGRATANHLSKCQGVSMLWLKSWWRTVRFARLDVRIIQVSRIVRWEYSTFRCKRHSTVALTAKSSLLHPWAGTGGSDQC